MEIKSIDAQKYTDAITQLFFNVFTGEPWNDEWKSVEQAKKYLLEIINIPNSRCFAIFEKDILTGFVLGNIRSWYSGKELYISEMCIKTESQRSGSGTKLIKYIEEYLRQENVNTIILLTSKDTFAYNFYKKNNFREIHSMKLLSRKF